MPEEGVRDEFERQGVGLHGKTSLCELGGIGDN